MIPVVVDSEWLVGHRNDVVVADVRWYLDGRSGLAAYLESHISGALFVDLDRCLCGPPSASEGRHPLPAPAVFAQQMATLGIGDADTVVAYDDSGGTTAARLVWMLRMIGAPAALLDGGLAAWDGPTEQEGVTRAPAGFTARPWPGALLASADDAAEPSSVVLDARDASRYRGDHEPVDPRAGHIPGARSLPCRENLRADGRFLAPEELRRRLGALGVHDAPRVVCYCGSGVTACHDLIAIEHAGLGRGRLYPGSWSQWSADP
ncbi:MAG: sulfurtransferase, partial [Acidimicrobiales bacterium]